MLSPDVELGNAQVAPLCVFDGSRLTDNRREIAGKPSSAPCRRLMPDWGDSAERLLQAASLDTFDSRFIPPDGHPAAVDCPKRLNPADAVCGFERPLSE